MRKKRRTVRLSEVSTLKNIQSKAIQLNAVDPSKVYVVELNELKAEFVEKAQIVAEIFKRQGIQVIVVPPKAIKIYKLSK